MSSADRALLERARELSVRGWGRVHPNPMVGCVITRNEEIVGEGYHAEYGGPHAEAMALAEAGRLASGGVAYVTLEPCAHAGKTPPCAEALAEAGVRRVVFATADPGPGAGGAVYLKSRQIEVVGPMWDESQARAHNPAFFHAYAAAGRTRRVPYVAVKLAMSLNALISAGRGKRTRVTGPEAESETHRLRSGFDAIMVGAETARVDDPSLTVRHAPIGRLPPARLVVDSLASMPPSSRMLSEVSEAPVHLLTTDRAPRSRITRLREAGADVHVSPARESGAVDLRAALEHCRSLGLWSVMCEGGGKLVSSLVSEDLVGHLYLFIAPKLLGSGGIAAFPGVTTTIWRAVSEPRRFGEDLFQYFEIDPPANEG